MNCEFYAVLLSGHIDGMNTPQEEDALQKHLQSCEHCRELLADMQENDRLLKAQEVQVPSDLTKKIMAEVRKTKKNKKPFYISLAASGLAAAAVLALAFSGKISSPTKEETQTAETTAAEVQRFELKQPIRSIQETDAPCEDADGYYSMPESEAYFAGATENEYEYGAQVAADDATAKGMVSSSVPVLVVKAKANEVDFSGEKIEISELMERLQKSEYELSGKETAVYAVTWQELQQIAWNYDGIFEMDKYYDEDATYLSAIVVFAES